MDAHCEAGFQVGRPFATEGLYDFATNRDMTRRVAGLGKVMLKHRLSPPPQDAYSLHRKLSGAFLACMRIGARVGVHAVPRLLLLSVHSFCFFVSFLPRRLLIVSAFHLR